MSRALHSGLNSSIFFKFLHNFAERWSYYKVLLEGMFIARDTDETTFYLIFCMVLFDAVIWIQLTPSRNTHVSGSLFCNSSISANINWAPASIILMNIIKQTVLSRLADINYCWLDVVRNLFCG